MKNRYLECPDCHGTAYLSCPDEFYCDEGFAWLEGPGHKMVFAGACSWCDGYGWVECGRCMGTGEVLAHIQLVAS
jgi:hypothetical protein